MQQPFDLKLPRNVPALLALRKRDDIVLFIAIFVVVLGLTPLFILEGVNLSFGMLLGLLAALICAALVVRWPMMGFFVVLGCVVVIEQNPQPISTGTDHLNVFYWPPQLAGLIERPIGFLILLVIAILLCSHFIKRQTLLQGGALSGALVFFILCVVGGIVHGLVSHGDLKIIVVEVRPFWYLFLSYLLAYNMMTCKKHLKAFFWIVILGAGVKSLQGLYILLVVLRGDMSGQNELMSHEESFFFVALVLLLFLFFLQYRYRAQMYATLLLLPGVLVSLAANNRRADYIALLVGLMVSWALLFMLRPRLRLKLVIGLLACTVFMAGYVAAFAHSAGSFAGPARAVLSIINPSSADARDAASNLYRDIENYDLKFTVKQNPILGMGFGIPFLRPIPLPDISDLDQYYIYVPHNTIYWVWVRLGPVGFLALWYLFGSIIVRGSQMVRQLKDPYLQLVAIYIVAVTFMEVIVAFADYQLFFYRNVMYLGLLAGILMRLPLMDKEKEIPAHETARIVPLPAFPNMGKSST